MEIIDNAHQAATNLLIGMFLLGSASEFDISFAGTNKIQGCGNGEYWAGQQLTVTGELRCDSCLGGRYGLGLDENCAGTCERGKYTSVGSRAASCTNCPAGKQTLGVGAALCLDCNPGKISATAGSSSGCVNCPAGMSSGTGYSACQDCDPGYFAATEGSTCSKCPAGTFANQSRTTECTECQRGRYGDEGEGVRAYAKGVLCSGPCAAGRFGASSRATSAQCSGACPAGKYSDAGLGYCSNCESGRYGATAGLQDYRCSGRCPGAAEASTACDNPAVTNKPTPSSSPALAPTPSPTTSSGEGMVVLIIGSVVALTAVCIVGGAVYYFFFRKRKDRTRVAAASADSAKGGVEPMKEISVTGKNGPSGMQAPPGQRASDPFSSGGFGGMNGIGASGFGGPGGMSQGNGFMGSGNMGVASPFGTMNSGMSLANGNPDPNSLQRLNSAGAFNSADPNSLSAFNSNGAFGGTAAVSNAGAFGAGAAFGGTLGTGPGGMGLNPSAMNQQLLLQQLMMGNRTSGMGGMGFPQGSIHAQNSLQMNQSSGMLGMNTLAAIGGLNTLEGGGPNMGKNSFIVGTGPAGIAYAQKDALKLWVRFQVHYHEVKVGDKLGRGAFGSVFKCSFRNDDKCAIKQLDMTGNSKARKAFLKEIRIMCSLSHPCTVRLYAWTPQPLAVIMELAACDLAQYYNNKKLSPYSLEKALRVCIDAAKGMLYIHSTGLIHRDLKSMNIMITEKVSRLWSVFLSPLGGTSHSEKSHS